MNIIINPEVKKAIEDKKPVVALESTIITHGMPYPTNVEMALRVEQTIRDEGAIPATIAFINGDCCIGLNKEQLETLATFKGAVKISRRDIPLVAAYKKTGGTTVAATMICADLANIRVFVTGGIGGVHRGAEKTMDISADLEELANTNVAVICAGAKAILDLPKTLEYLETKGVPVLGYKTECLPAFYSNRSPYKVDAQVNSAKEIASIMKEKWDAKLKGGILITNPVQDEYSMDYDYIDSLVKVALDECNKKGIKGKDTTPFLLDKMRELTNGESLATNVELVLNNARLGAAIAKEYYNG